jgi:hypothetical protein
MTRIGLGVLLFVILGQGSYARAQSRASSPEGKVDQPVCDKIRATLLVQDQVEEAKKLDDSIKRIGILVPAAGMLWAERQDQARALFQQAFDLAVQWNADHPVQTSRDGMLLVISPDPRLTVVNAISRYDREWARRLIKDITEHDIKAARENSGSTSGRRPESSTDFLNLAMQLVTIDRPAAIQLARDSLAYPASTMLPRFLFALAAADQNAADALYQQALSSYAGKDIDSTLYLAVYPFGLTSTVGQPHASTNYGPESSFVPNLELQQQYLRMLFDRAGRAIDPTSQRLVAAPAPGSMPETAQIYLALQQLEPSIAQYQPTLSEQAAQLKALMFASLTPETSRQATGFLEGQRVWKEDPFNTFLQRADADKDPDRRDADLALAVIQAPDSEAFARLYDIASKISDGKIRTELLDWLYFRGARNAIKRGELDEATRLAGKLEKIEWRAYLSFEIAAEALKRTGDKSRAFEILNEVLKTADKAPETPEKARALLGVSFLFAKFDQVMAVQAMGSAIKTINALDQPDLTQTVILQRIEGKQFASYTNIPVEGFSIQNAFKLLAPSDFDGALLLAQKISDKSLRSLVILAMVNPCLEQKETAPRKEAAPRKPEPRKADPQKPDPQKPGAQKPDPQKPDPQKPDSQKPDQQKPDAPKAQTPDHD